MKLALLAALAALAMVAPALAADVSPSPRTPICTPPLQAGTVHVDPVCQDAPGPVAPSPIDENGLKVNITRAPPIQVGITSVPPVNIASMPTLQVNVTNWPSGAITTENVYWAGTYGFVGSCSNPLPTPTYSVPAGRKLFITDFATFGYTHTPRFNFPSGYSLAIPGPTAIISLQTPIRVDGPGTVTVTPVQCQTGEVGFSGYLT